jgi:hypothetical protein
MLPERDLWPQIAAGITAAGTSEHAAVRRVSVSESRTNSGFPPGFYRWTWRLAAVAILGSMLVLAATYLRNHHSSTASKTAVVPTDLERDGRNLRAPAVPGTQALTRDLRIQPVAATPPQNGSAPGDFNEACQCGPSAQILTLIDKAWMVDENLPSQRERKVVAERLYQLAGENADNFFLHKASLEACPYRPPVTNDMTIRYRTRLAQHPDDPVSTYLYAYTMFGKNTAEMIRLMGQLIAEHPEFPWPNLALAEFYGYPSKYTDKNKVQSYLQAFMKLCPKSPEPTRRLVALENSNFLADAVRRMRVNLAAQSDTQSMLLYNDLWYLEAIRGATDEQFSTVQQRIKDDLEREGAETPELARHLPWKSNILKVASLYANQGVLLSEVPALIKEGLEAAEKHNREITNDLPKNPQWVSLMRRVSDWLEADDAWHSLAAAYLRLGRPDNALDALSAIEPALADFKSQLAQFQADAKADDSVIITGQRQSIANQLAEREERYIAARARIAQAAKK